MKNKIILCLILITCINLTACGNEKNSQDTSEISNTSAITEGETNSNIVGNGKTYSDTILDEEKNSIKMGKLSKNHEFYQEVVTLDSQCADYINEISIYDKEIDDTFIVHVSLPPNYDENGSYPMVVMTDGVWRLSDHPELRTLMKSGEINDVILVSIGYPDGYEYTSIRERDLVRDPESFLHFIVDNLIPYLLEIYPASSENMTLTGHSYGGYWALFALLNSDIMGKNIFDNYYIGSPSMQASTDNKTIYFYETQYNLRKDSLDANVYVTVGADENNSFISAIESFNQKLLSREFNGLKYDYEVIEGYDHNNVFKPSIKNTLLKFYGK